MGQVHAKGYFWNLEFLVNMKHLFSLLTINIKVWELQNTFSVGVSSSLLEWSVYSASQGWAGVKICSWVMLVFCLVDMRIGGLFGLRWDKINRTLSASLPYPFVLPRGGYDKTCFCSAKAELVSLRGHRGTRNISQKRWKLLPSISPSIPTNKANPV